MSNAPLHLSIDGKWVRCVPAEDYGYLSIRYYCDLSSTPGQPAKRLLIRSAAWPQAGGNQPAQLNLAAVPQNGKVHLRPVVVKDYEQTMAQSQAPPQTQLSRVLQQDITGLVSLKGAVLQAFKQGEPQRIWQLFYNACKTLDEFGKVAGNRGQPVPLQCPMSLAVGQQNQIVLLDAEVQLVGGVSTHAEASQTYAKWFGSAASTGFVSSDDASRLHAHALILYFRELLGALQQKTQADPAVLGKIAPLNQIPSGLPLQGVENWIRGTSGNFDIFVDREEMQEMPAAPIMPVTAALAPTSSNRSLLLRFSLWANLLLAIALILVFLLWKPVSGSGENEREKEKGKTPVPLLETGPLFSSYCVVFPAQGTIGEKVESALKELFPGKVVPVSLTPTDRSQMLKKKRDESLKSLEEPDKLKKLLVKLTRDHSVRLKGFAAADPDEGVKTVLERAGIYTIGSSSGEQHGSLLQPDGLVKILDHAKLREDKEAPALLRGLRKAITDYVSLRDALTIVGDRSAYLLPVEPTAAAHDEVRKKLLSRLDKPVFLAHPIPELFDSVDPTADIGGGFAKYTLQLDRSCFWRLASLEDRKDVDFKNNASNDRMKWLPLPARTPKTWTPIPLTKTNGKTDISATFDIGVVLEAKKKVVVFRNQSLMVGDTAEQVRMQGKRYIERGLGLGVVSIDEAVSVRDMGDQYSGTLIYSFLADRVVMEDKKGRDLEVVDMEKFKVNMKTEDAELTKRP